MIDRLALQFPDFDHLQESALEGANGISLWQVTALSKVGRPLGTGFAGDLVTARKIAIAEFIERSFVLELKKSKKLGNWHLHEFPTACGFAAGFDQMNTQIRSIGEALERWALSQWVDRNCYLEHDISPLWSPESLLLMKDFDSAAVFKKEFIYSINGKLLPYNLCALICFKGKGAYMGSGIRSNYQDAMTHAVVEAHRHLLISRQDRNFSIFPFNRIKHFSERKDLAIGFIKKVRTSSWSNPILKFQKDFQNELFCVTRTIFEDWIPWECGNIDRMLY